jgi:hypothetical protein
MLLARGGKSPPHGRFGRARPLRPVSALPLPSRTGRRSEREFRGHVGGVLPPLPGFALAEPGLASLLALVPQFPRDESLGCFLSMAR